MSFSTSQVPNITLRGDVEIPQLGFGVFQVPPEETAEAVTRALLAGYRHIDTAAAYRNEAARRAGRPRRRASTATRSSSRPSASTTTTATTRPSARCKDSLDRLEMDHVDLYLIHWPVPVAGPLRRDLAGVRSSCRRRASRASIGVSNFQPAHLERIIDETGVTPAVNQVELHPRLQQAGLRREHADRGIVTEAWSPLAQGAVLDDPAIVEIAEAHDKTPAQVVLRWHLQLGNVVIPKSVTPERIEENFDVFDFHLSDDEMAAIEALDAGERIGPDPDTFVRPPG